MLLWIILSISIVNSVLIIGIAGSLVKVLSFMEREKWIPFEKNRNPQLENLPDKSYYRMENGSLIQEGVPAYDQAVLDGKLEPYADGLFERPSLRNWNGIPSEEI